jgi:bacterioferritin
MKGNDKVITQLNQCLSASLTAINQFFIHSEMCRDWGYKDLYERFRKESIRAMRRAEKLIRRILYLEGQSNISDYLKIQVGNNLEKQLSNDLQLEMIIIGYLERGITICRDVEDDVSKELLEDMVSLEEDYIDWLEVQIGMIHTIGLQNYLAKNIYD